MLDLSTRPPVDLAGRHTRHADRGRGAAGGQGRSDRLPAERPAPGDIIQGFRQGLREVGYVEGQNVSIEYGLAGGTAQLPAVVAELVRRKVAVIIASGTPSVPAAKIAASTIPIVFVASIDPVATGMVASLARPGGTSPAWPASTPT